MKRMMGLVALMAAMVIGGCGDSSSGGGGGGPAAYDLSGYTGMPFLAAATVGGTTGSYSIMVPGRIYSSLAVFDTTDLGVTVANDSVFVYGKYDADWLARFDLDDTLNPVYQYSLVGTSEGSQNPSAVVIVTDDVGYVFRYGSSTAWIIDPSPADEASFKIGEIDLSPYETTGMFGDNPPNPVKALVRGTTMYVLLERSNGWAYDMPGMLLTIDISTPAIPVINDAFDLIVVSPNSMDILGNDLFIAGWGVLGYAAYSMPHVPAGGIEKVDLSGGAGSYTSSLLVDDDDGSDTSGNPYTYGGAATMVAVASNTLGFIYFAEWNDPAVYRVHPFNPTTGVVDDATVILDGINLSTIAIGPDGFLYCSASAWYGLGATAGLYLVNPSSFMEIGPQSVGLEPVAFGFNN